jgi:hypothetical protein
MRPEPVRIGSPRYFWRLHWRLRDRLPMWIVYRPTTEEYPGLWVARMHVLRPKSRPTRFVMTHPALSDLRDMLPPDVTRVARQEADAPQIEELWF